MENEAGVLNDIYHKRIMCDYIFLNPKKQT